MVENQESQYKTAGEFKVGDTIRIHRRVDFGTGQEPKKGEIVNVIISQRQGGHTHVLIDTTGGIISAGSNTQASLIKKGESTS